MINWLSSHDHFITLWGSKLTITCIWNGHNILGEGPLWDPSQQVLYWLDIEQAQLHQLNPKTKQHQQWLLPEKASAIALGSKNNLLITFSQQFGFIEIPSGKITYWLKPTLSANEVFNDGKCDRNGRFWIGSKDIKEKSTIGALYRLDLDGKFTKMDEGFIVSNGMGWSPDNKYFYFTDGDLHRQILRYDFDLVTGKIFNRKIFTKIPEELGYPDGLTVDAEGYVWSAHWDGWRITRYTPDGRVDKIIPTPIQKPTSCCFGVGDLKTLFITSATRDLSKEQLQQQPLAGGVFSTALSCVGISEAKFAK